MEVNSTFLCPVCQTPYDTKIEAETCAVDCVFQAATILKLKPRRNVIARYLPLFDAAKVRKVLVENKS